MESDLPVYRGNQLKKYHNLFDILSFLLHVLFITGMSMW